MKVCPSTGWRAPSPALVALTKAERRPRATTAWQLVHAVADRMVGSVRRAFLNAITGAAAMAGTLRDVEEAVRSGSTWAVLDALKLDTVRDELGKRLAGGEFVSALTTTYQLAGTGLMPEVLRQLAKQKTVTFQLRFDMQHPRAVEFLKAYEGNLIREVTAEQARAMIDVTQKAFEEGGHPYAQARKIRAVENFGLTQQQNTYVWNYRKAQEAAGVTGKQLDDLVARYRKKLLRYRSENIARTETIRASEAGHQEAWRQAADAGLLDPDTSRRFWVVTPDDRLCPNCRAIPGLNPNGVPLDGEFATPYGPRSRPPAHPQCRCSQVVRFIDVDDE